MLATNDQAMETLRPYVQNETLLSFYSKLTAGFFASFFSIPFDFIKTRLQKQQKLPDGTLPYKK